ncbi:MAG: TAXI family TRAP transporter solute-binding subunit [Candidatus Eisenbacteria bacterium]|uniref:TAXI family TRAP transporter solute-binding subunit n=1 Tax=Eiseniibacteriota bacterium TaxID=2212470 RepID=A0A956NBB2_UNCEI|nr:TAXI family TRAP transporter solute-binding subunit [Candidatus Eisenbacteria bacterium]MCB9463578.1 TAXI family TRAP transporter solute-binding subunit [Candidatus Eisenbacteria bacterium]
MERNLTSRRFVLSLVLVAAFAWVAKCDRAEAAEARDYLLATASTGGTYYPVGVAISTLVKVKLQPTEAIGLSAISSAGSGENVKLMRDNEVQFGILQGLYGHWAFTGTGELEKEGPQTELRSVSMLWQNVEHFVVADEFAKTGTISDFVDLKGKRTALGKKNSGTLGSNAAILANFGVNVETDYDLMFGGYGPSADALQNGQVSGISTPAGVPAGAITKLFAAMGDKVKLLAFTPDQVKQADGGMELWSEYVIPGGTYPSLDQDTHTIAQPNFLACRADVDEDAVYLMTKTIYENLAFLQAIHKATDAMAIEKAIVGLPMPLHPGAAKYYREVGIQIPDRLIAK